MTAKDFLNQAYLLDQRIKSKSEQIQSLNKHHHQENLYTDIYLLFYLLYQDTIIEM